MNVGYEFAVLVAGYMTAAAIVDYRTRKIPNWLTVPAAVLGLVYHTLAPQGMGPLAALAGFAIGFSLLILPWILGGGGMGDVKMLAALGAWLGPLLILVAFGMGAVLAMVMAVGVMLSGAMTVGMGRTQRRFATAGAGVPGEEPRKRKRVLPFAVPVAVATWLMLAWLVLRVPA